MKLVIKNNKVIAIHDSNQNITKSMYPYSDSIKDVPDSTVVQDGDFTVSDEEGLRAIVRRRINDKTDDSLKNIGCLYNGVRFRLDAEHINDYKDAIAEIQMIAEAGGNPFPYKIKGIGNAYYNLVDSSDVQGFFSAGALAKKMYISDGWAVKDGGTTSAGVVCNGLQGLDINQLLNFTDPRSYS